MATTTNYGWTTPDDTALVKDGASAIRSLGTAIDTTVFNNASAAIAKTIVDAKGDIIAATAADTVSRLAVGANDTVLTADSSTATGLKWATAGGGLTLASIASGTTTSGTTLTFSSLTQDYLVFIGNAFSVGTAGTITATINSNSTGVYNYNGFRIRDTFNTAALHSQSATSIPLTVANLEASETTNGIVLIFENAKKAGFTSFQHYTYSRDTAGNTTYVSMAGFVALSAQMTSLTLTFAGTLSAGNYKLIGG